MMMIYPGVDNALSGFMSGAGRRLAAAALLTAAAACSNSPTTPAARDLDTSGTIESRFANGRQAATRVRGFDQHAEDTTDVVITTAATGDDDLFDLAADETGSALAILNGGGHEASSDFGDTFRLETGGRLSNIYGLTFLERAPATRGAGNLFLQNVETIVLEGGTVTGGVYGETTGTAGTAANDIIAYVNNPANEIVTSLISVLADGDLAADGIQIFLDGATVSENIVGRAVADIIALGAGQVGGRVVTGGGGDLVIIGRRGGLTITGNIETGGNNDFITADLAVASGSPAFSIGGIDGGSDRRSVASARDFNADVDLGDAFILTGGTVATIIMGTQTGSSDANTIRLANIESLGLEGGAVVTGDITTGPASTYVHIFNSAAVMGTINAGNNFDYFAVILEEGETGTVQIGTEGSGNGPGTGGINAGGGNDIFDIEGEVDIYGLLDGQAGTDTLLYRGSAFPGDDPVYLAPDQIAGIEACEDERDGGGPPNCASSLTASAQGRAGFAVASVEKLAVSPALALYGALGDALMTLGGQTMIGIGLADADLSTGRAQALALQQDPVSGRRIWAHEISLEVAGTGRIGLPQVRGLSARQATRHNYDARLIQQGFDAPVIETGAGRAIVRAVAHHMTGKMEIDGARAALTGYGAGAAFLWQGAHGLSAHASGLGSLYEIESHTTGIASGGGLLDRRAFGNNGVFDALSLSAAAGLVWKRQVGESLSLTAGADLLWQRLTIDDVIENGRRRLAVSFENQDALTARAQVGLDAESWFADLALIHRNRDGALVSGLRQTYAKADATAFEAQAGGRIVNLAPGLVLEGGLRLRQPLAAAAEASARLGLNWRF